MMLAFVPLGVDAILGNGCRILEENCFAQFQKVVIEFLFKKLKLICERWKWGSALRLKSQP